LKAEFEMRNTYTVLEYQFFDFSTGNPDSCYWEFGNGDSSYLRNPGSEKIIRSVHSGVGGQWNNNSPFVAPSYHISDYDWGYMSKVVEKIILELI
jgi:hypothetical protein